MENYGKLSGKRVQHRGSMTLSCSLARLPPLAAKSCSGAASKQIRLPKQSSGPGALTWLRTRLTPMFEGKSM